MNFNSSELDAASKIVDEHMRLTYGRTVASMVPTATPGYWEDMQPLIHHGHPLHGWLGCDGPFKATYTFFDKTRGADGKVRSATATWALLVRTSR